MPYANLMRIIYMKGAPTGIGRVALVNGTGAARGRCQMSPPTSLWWALETPLTLARRGIDKRPSGGHSGGCGRPMGEEIMHRSRHYMCFN